jgi:hypothetical protein
MKEKEELGRVELMLDVIEFTVVGLIILAIKLKLNSSQNRCSQCEFFQNVFQIKDYS